MIAAATAGCGPGAREPSDDEPGIDAPVAPSVDALPVVPTGPVDVVITADNAYSFGYGDAGMISHFTQGARATTAGEIFNCGEGPEAYQIPEADAPASAYLFIVSWDDHAVTQGVLAQFTRASSHVMTGDPGFEVCATGLDFSSSGGPDLATINTEIARCNAGTGDPATSSAGWVDASGPVAATPNSVGTLAVGEPNDMSTGTFPIACQPAAGVAGIESVAKWMWYDPHDGQTGDAFHSSGGNRFKAFLIFRLGVADIIL